MRTRAVTPALAMALICAAPAAGASSEKNDFVTQGSLLVNQGPRVVKVPLEHTEVMIRVSGYLAEATVRQRFRNPFEKKIEAVYAFPLPTDSAVWGFSLRNGERVIRGRILPRGEARAVYRRATLAGRVAALLTQERPNLFTQHVANLVPGAPVEVTLRYVSRLRYDAGSYELVFPMVVGPRFVPRKAGRKGNTRLLSPPVLPPDLRSAHDIDLQVELEAGLPIDGPRSPSHRLRSQRRSVSAVSVAIAATDRVPNRDFVLRYRVAGDRPRAALITHRGDPGAPGSLLLMVQPPAAGKLVAVPRELIFVVDASSSMTGAPLGAAKRLVRRFLAGLGRDDTFQIVRFSDRVSTLGPRMVANRPANRALALRWVERLRAGGGTLIEEGLKAALGLPHDPARLRMVVFISDGYVGNEAALLGLVRRRMGQARLFALGVGSAVNRYLLEEMAAMGRGLARVVRPDEPVERTVDRLYERLRRPLLTDLTVELRGVRVASMTPGRIPDLYEGEPLFLHGLYRAPGRGTLVVRGRRQGVPVKLELPVELPRRETGHRAVALAWARARIAELERRLVGTRGDKERVALERQILELSLRHKILTRLTAFVAVDEDSSTGADKAARVRVAVDRPQFTMRSLGGLGSGGGVVVSYGHSYGAGRGALIAHRAAVAPRILVGRAIVRGSLDKEILRRVIRRHLNEVRFCYEKELGPNKKAIGGRVELKLVIDETGKVVTSEVASSSLGNPAVGSCVAAAGRRWEFPSVSGGGIVEVHYPFVFRPVDPGRGR